MPLESIAVVAGVKGVAEATLFVGIPTLIAAAFDPSMVASAIVLIGGAVITVGITFRRQWIEVNTGSNAERLCKAEDRIGELSELVDANKTLIATQHSQITTLATAVHARDQRLADAEKVIFELATEALRDRHRVQRHDPPPGSPTSSATMIVPESPGGQPPCPSTSS